MDSRIIMRRRGIAGCAGGMAVAMLAASCASILGIEELSSGFAVRGTVSGVLRPVALELYLGDDVELLTVSQEGTFAFETALSDGASYTVMLADPAVPCTLRNQTGVIAGADAVIEVSCTGASLATLEITTVEPAIVTLVPGTTEYAVDLSLLQQSATVTASVATQGDTMMLGGVALASGEASEPIVLSLGDNPLDIVVENSMGWKRTYRLNLRRAAQPGQIAYGKASNTDAGDYFGWNVALSGDTLVVGAIYEDSASAGVGGNQTDENAMDSGAVYVFRRVGARWEQEAYLKASHINAGDQFGHSVALSNDTLAVGAYGDDSAATGVGEPQGDLDAPGSGAVYVFRRTGTTWAQEAYLKAANTGAGDRFGLSVALADDTLAVGAYRQDSTPTDVNEDSGAVYVFRRTGTRWEQEAYLKASSTGPGDNFGVSVALAGDTLAVGAWFEDSASTGVNGNPTNDDAANSGAVYVFRRVGANWGEEAYVKASNTGAGDEFGHSIALAGDTLAVGARYEDGASTGVDGNPADDSIEDSGAVYVFRRAGTGWEQEAYVKASNTGADDRFGYSIALAGNALAVGAYREDGASTGVGGNPADDSALESGAVYVFHRLGTSWGQEAYVKASNTGANDYFGTSVALAGDTLAVGAWLEASASTGVNGDQTDNSALESGAVYIFH